MLEDVQARADDRHLPIDEVGITGIRYPVAVVDREHGKQDTIAEVSLSADLAPGVKGAHLSRFVEILNQAAGEISPRTIPSILDAIGTRLDASYARIEASFSFFLRRTAPVTGASALMDYRCWLVGDLDACGARVSLGAQVPVTSLCPCSKAISDYGAHNQRSTITIYACLRGEAEQPAELWLEELIEVAEAAASSPVFPLLKRPDERHVTMHAYDHPVFVEDMLRSVAQVLGSDARISSFAVEAASEESIHNHRAFARIQSPTVAEGWMPRLTGRSS
jgi:GTP cyclohydrolase IB